MSVQHLSYARVGGGAAEAAYRLHRELLLDNYDSRFRCLGELHLRDRLVISSRIGSLALRFANITKHYSSRMALKAQISADLQWRSLSLFPSVFDLELNRSDCKVVHLHWVQSEFISIEAISRIKKKLVWTLHDNWPLCGAEHHPSSQEDRRFIDGYSKLNRASSARGLDLDKWCWNRKVNSWRPDLFTLVAPSLWSKKQALKSHIFRDSRVEVIPNIVDSQFYVNSTCRDAQRADLGINQDDVLISLGAAYIAKDANKGLDIVDNLLCHLSTSKYRVRLALFGFSPFEKERFLSQNRGRTSEMMALPYLDKQSLAGLYRSSDIIVVPSRVESFGLIAAEAQVSGVPVVGYDTSGLKDIVINGTTGFLVECFNETKLIERISTLVNDNAMRQRMRAEAQLIARPKFSARNIVQRHIRLYESL